jgi:L-arabinokinase
VSTVLFYVSGHGFGHAVRSAEVVRALLQRPGVRVRVRTDAPAWFFPKAATRCALPTDVGLAQRDSLEHDLDETVRRLRHYFTELPALAEREAAWAAREDVSVVVGDIPPLAFEVARRLGVPGIGIANFGWDEIYAGLPGRPAEIEWAIDAVAQAYSRADLLLRMPFHLPMAAFRRAEDIPLVARRTARTRAETRSGLGLAPERPLVLLSFGGYDLAGLDLRPLSGLRKYTFIITPRVPLPAVPDNVVQLGREQQEYADLVAASDVVVTKLGYGIVADCLANGARVLYTDRPGFAEYPFLAEAIQRLAPARHVPQAALRGLDLGPALETVLEMDRPRAEIRLDGAEVAAQRILGCLDESGTGDTVGSRHSPAHGQPIGSD